MGSEFGYSATSVLSEMMMNIAFFSDVHEAGNVITRALCFSNPQTECQA